MATIVYLNLKLKRSRRGQKLYYLHIPGSLYRAVKPSKVKLYYGEGDIELPITSWRVGRGYKIRVAIVPRVIADKLELKPYKCELIK